MNFNRTQLFYFVLISCFIMANSNLYASVDKAINGDDNRTEITSAPPFAQNLSQAIAGHFLVDSLTKNGNVYSLNSYPLGKKHCASVRFADQYTGPRCTGFLVGPNLIATAGHCMNQPNDCQNYLWAFDFQLKSAGDSSYTKIPAEKVFTCKRIVSQKYNALGGIDYTLIELDRKVPNREPVVMDFTGDTSAGTPVYMLGYPSGLPLKYTDGALITKDTAEYFDTDLDVFGGNSGSPVFSAITNHVIGIVSMANSEWTNLPGASCKTEKICRPEDHCFPSLISKIKFLKDAFESVGK